MKQPGTLSVAPRRARGSALCLIALLALLAAGITRGGPAWAEGSPVASVIAIDGKLMLERPGAGKYAAFVQMPDYVNDRLSTDAKSVAAVEFVVGGKVGINPNSTVVITGNRSAADGSGQVLQIKSGAVWAKFDKQKSSLLIKTPTATLGIRGTEFLVNADEQSTTVEVFEGKVAYAPTKDGDAVAALPADAAVADAGMRVVIDAALKAKVEKYDPEKLRKDAADKYKDLAGALVALRIVSNIAGFIPGGSTLYPAIGYANLAVDVIADPEQAARNFAASQIESRVPMGGLLGGVIRSGGGGGAKKDPDFPIDLTPYNKDDVEPSGLRFSWKAFKDAKRYVVLVSKNESMEQSNLQWASTVSDTGVQYPADGPPLEGGQKYYWRVVAMNDEGKAIGKASQSWFTVPASYKAPGT